MAVIINHVRYSYYYDELIADLQEDLLFGDCTKETTINIVRDRNRTIADSYHPIIVYYYLDDLENLETPLEDLENPEEYTVEEWEAMKAERQEWLEQYHEYEPYFEPITVGEALDEMNEWTSIL